MIYNIDYVRNKPLVTLSDGKRGNEAGSDEPSEDQARDIYIYIYIYYEGKRDATTFPDKPVS